MISREKFRRIVSATQTLRFVNLILKRLTIVEIDATPHLSRDPKDNYLLALALRSDADYLITGDDDLLVLKQIGNAKIVTMSDFQSLRLG